MLQPQPASKKARTDKAILFLTIAAAIFWMLTKLIDPYSWAAVGAIFELLWLPTLGVLFILPIVSFIFWIKEKFRLKSFNFYSILIAVLAVTAIFLFQ